jgi:hypothetical protein
MMTFGTFRRTARGVDRLPPETDLRRARSGRRPIGWTYGLLLVVFAALQVADVVTTNYALAVPGAHEANPLMALFQSHLGAAWWLPKAAVVVFAFAVAPRTRRRWPMAMAVSIYGVVVIGNLACL